MWGAAPSEGLLCEQTAMYIQQYAPQSIIVIIAISLQEIAGFWLTKLLSVCSERKPSPNSKLVRNLCLLAGCSPYEVPSFQETYTVVEPTAASRAAENPSSVIECTWSAGILSLAKVSKKVVTSTTHSSDCSYSGPPPHLSCPITYVPDSFHSVAPRQ